MLRTLQVVAMVTWLSIASVASAQATPPPSDKQLVTQADKAEADAPAKSPKKKKRSAAVFVAFMPMLLMLLAGMNAAKKRREQQQTQSAAG